MSHPYKEFFKGNNSYNIYDRPTIPDNWDMWYYSRTFYYQDLYKKSSNEETGEEEEILLNDDTKGGGLFLPRVVLHGETIGSNIINLNTFLMSYVMATDLPPPDPVPPGILLSPFGLIGALGATAAVLTALAKPFPRVNVRFSSIAYADGFTFGDQQSIFTEGHVVNDDLITLDKSRAGVDLEATFGGTVYPGATYKNKLKRIFIKYTQIVSYSMVQQENLSYNLYIILDLKNDFPEGIPETAKEEIINNGISVNGEEIEVDYITNDDVILVNLSQEELENINIKNGSYIFFNAPIYIISPYLLAGKFYGKTEKFNEYCSLLYNVRREWKSYLVPRTRKLRNLGFIPTESSDYYITSQNRFYEKVKALGVYFYQPSIDSLENESNFFTPDWKYASLDVSFNQDYSVSLLANDFHHEVYVTQRGRDNVVPDYNRYYMNPRKTWKETLLEKSNMSIREWYSSDGAEISEEICERYFVREGFSLSDVNFNDYYRLDISKGGTEFRTNWHVPILEKAIVIQEGKEYLILKHVDFNVIDVSIKSVDGEGIFDFRQDFYILNEYGWVMHDIVETLQFSWSDLSHYSRDIPEPGLFATPTNNIIVGEREDGTMSRVMNGEERHLFEGHNALGYMHSENENFNFDFHERSRWANAKNKYFVPPPNENVDISGDKVVIKNIINGEYLLNDIHEPAMRFTGFRDFVFEPSLVVNKPRGNLPGLLAASSRWDFSRYDFNHYHGNSILNRIIQSIKNGYSDFYLIIEGFNNNDSENLVFLKNAYKIRDIDVPDFEDIFKSDWNMQTATQYGNFINSRTIVPNINRYTVEITLEEEVNQEFLEKINERLSAYVVIGKPDIDEFDLLDAEDEEGDENEDEEWIDNSPTAHLRDLDFPYDRENYFYKNNYRPSYFTKDLASVSGMAFLNPVSVSSTSGLQLGRVGTIGMNIIPSVRYTIYNEGITDVESTYEEMLDMVYVLYKHPKTSKLHFFYTGPSDKNILVEGVVCIGYPMATNELISDSNVFLTGILVEYTERGLPTNSINYLDVYFDNDRKKVHGINANLILDPDSNFTTKYNLDRDGVLEYQNIYGEKVFPAIHDRNCFIPCSIKTSEINSVHVSDNTISKYYYAEKNQLIRPVNDTSIIKTKDGVLHIIYNQKVKNTSDLAGSGDNWQIENAIMMISSFNYGQSWHSPAFKVKTEDNRIDHLKPLFLIPNANLIQAEYNSNSNKIIVMYESYADLEGQERYIGIIEYDLRDFYNEERYLVYSVEHKSYPFGFYFYNGNYLFKNVTIDFANLTPYSDTNSTGVVIPVKSILGHNTEITNYSPKHIHFYFSSNDGYFVNYNSSEGLSFLYSPGLTSQWKKLDVTIDGRCGSFYKDSIFYIKNDRLMLLYVGRRFINFIRNNQEEDAQSLITGLPIIDIGVTSLVEQNVSVVDRKTGYRHIYYLDKNLNVSCLVSRNHKRYEHGGNF